MQKKFYQTTEFKDLAKLWEEKLEKDGLPDIEKHVGNRQVLKQNSPNVYRQMDSFRREAKEDYFRIIGFCVQDLAFDNEVDKLVMEHKAKGAKITEICEALLKAGMSRYRRTVRLIIRKYEDRWGIRTWRPEQLKYNWTKKIPIR